MKKNIRKFLRNKLAVFGLVVIVVITVACIGAAIMGIDYSTDCYISTITARAARLQVSCLSSPWKPVTD